MKFQRTGLELTFDITRSILVKFMKENTHIHSIFDKRKSVSVYLMREIFICVQSDMVIYQDVLQKSL